MFVYARPGNVKQCHESGDQPPRESTIEPPLVESIHRDPRVPLALLLHGKGHLSLQGLGERGEHGFHLFCFWVGGGRSEKI